MGPRDVVGLATALLAVGMGIAGCEDPEAPPVDDGPLILHDIHVQPAVTRAGESFTLSLDVANVAGSVLMVRPGDAVGLRREGEESSLLTLYDDGTHGDAIAGDGRFTVDHLIQPPGPAGLASVPLTYLTDLREPGDQTNRKLWRVKASFRTVDPARIDTPAIVELAGDARATSRVLALSTGGRAYDMVAAARRYYELLPDDRDFLVVLRAGASVSDASGRAIHVRQTTRGIGASVGEADNTYGSPGRLQMVVELNRDLYRSIDPPGYCLLTHELMHRWAAFLGPPLQGEYERHWAGALARDSSAFGAGRGQCVMNDLELYLAGLTPADSVTPLTVNGYNIEDVIGTHGARVPDYTESQRDFTLALIVVAERPLADHELAYFHHIAAAYAASGILPGTAWEGVTGGRSYMDTRLLLPPTTRSTEDRIRDRQIGS